MSDENELQTLERRIDISSRFFGRVFAGLTIATYRDRGEPALHQLFRDFMSSHQEEFFLVGLQKLGIGSDEPPAVKAGKYHYFSNRLGGLVMQYVEESPKKVWIRHLAPGLHVYEGLELLALPASLGRTIYSIWHPRNGELLGCPRLGWVVTKLVCEGDPYDEGYFIEHDRDLAPDEILRFERADSTPEFDPAAAPKLDPKLWPRERILKAKANYAAGYVPDVVERIRKRHGDDVAWRVLARTMRDVAIHYTDSLRQKLGVPGNGLRDVTSFCSALLDGCFQSFTREHLSERHERIRLETFKPFETAAPEPLRAAWFAFHLTSTHLINGRVRLTRSCDSAGREIWDFVDTGRWFH